MRGARLLLFARNDVDDASANRHPHPHRRRRPGRPCDVYVTSLAGWELGRERMATLDAAKPPPESPQRRERCPQNMFDPILRDFASAQPGVTLRYLTRLMSFTQDAAGVTAEVEDASGARERIRAQY